MAYTPKWNHLRDQILDIAAGVIDDYPADWAAVAVKDNTYIRRVAWACQRAGLSMVGLNGKRGDVNDLSTDVLAFPNATGCEDATHTHPGLELHDIIHASDSPQKALAWGDSTQATIDGGASGAWVTPTPVDDSEPPDPPPSTNMVLYQSYPQDETIFDQAGVAIEADYKRSGRTSTCPHCQHTFTPTWVLDPASVRWTARIMQDHLMGDAPPPDGQFLTLEESIAKHRAEWCAALGIPVV